MDALESIISNVKKAAETHGLAALARESGVSYTTIKSFADRGWSHKNLEVVAALARGADLLAQSNSSPSLHLSAAFQRGSD